MRWYCTVFGDTYSSAALRGSTDLGPQAMSPPPPEGSGSSSSRDPRTWCRPPALSSRSQRVTYVVRAQREVELPGDADDRVGLPPLARASQRLPVSEVHPRRVIAQRQAMQEFQRRPRTTALPRAHRPARRATGRARSPVAPSPTGARVCLARCSCGRRNASAASQLAVDDQRVGHHVRPRPVARFVQRRCPMPSESAAPAPAAPWRSRPPPRRSARGREGSGSASFRSPG